MQLAGNHVTGARQEQEFGYVKYKNKEGELAAVQKVVKPFSLVVSKGPVLVDYVKETMKGSFWDREGMMWSWSSKAHENNKRGGPTTLGRSGRVGGRGGFGSRGGGTGFGGRSPR